MMGTSWDITRDTTKPSNNNGLDAFISCFFLENWVPPNRTVDDYIPYHSSCHVGVSIFRHTQKRVQNMLQEGGEVITQLTYNLGALPDLELTNTLF